MLLLLTYIVNKFLNALTCIYSFTYLIFSFYVILLFMNRNSICLLNYSTIRGFLVLLLWRSGGWSMLPHPTLKRMSVKDQVVLMCQVKLTAACDVACGWLGRLEGRSLIAGVNRTKFTPEINRIFIVTRVTLPAERDMLTVSSWPKYPTCCMTAIYNTE